MEVFQISKQNRECIKRTSLGASFEILWKVRTVLTALIILVSAFTVCFLPAFAEEVKGTIQIPVNLQVNEEAPSDQKYTFTLTAVDGAPEPTSGNKTLTITATNGAGSGKFDTIEFSRPGDYKYKIKQTTAGNTQLTVDDTEYTFIVRVWNNDQGTISAECVREDKPEEKTELTYTNTYKVPDTTTASTTTTTTSKTTTTVKTGDDNPLLLYCGIIAVAALLLILLVAKRKRDRD